MRSFIIGISILVVYFVSAPELVSGQIRLNPDSLSTSHLSRKRVIPIVYYSNPDHIFAGLRFRIGGGRVGKDPDAAQHIIQLRYSISQNAFSALYNTRFNHLIGKWDLKIGGYYDWVIWTNFFGLGNETPRTNRLTYYRLSTSEYDANVGVSRIFGSYHYVELGVNVQGVEVLDRPGTLIADKYINDRAYYFEHHNYAGPQASYTYQRVDNPMVPERGVMAYVGGGYVWNVSEIEKSYGKANAIVQGYIPLVKKVSLSLRAGASTVTGDPEFYQYVSVGGPMTVRGYARDRFWGRTSFYNSNELRYITDFKVWKLSGKIGVLALFDDGRVWADNENSNLLHTGYGGGLLIAPFNKFTGMVTYAQSPEGGLVQVRINKLLSEIPAWQRHL